MEAHKADREHRSKARPLRFARPELYDRLLTELKTLHIHSFDVQASIIEKEKDAEIILRFGDDFSQSMSETFSYEAIQRINEEVISFFKEATEKSQQAIVADYYKMMKP